MRAIDLIEKSHQQYFNELKPEIKKYLNFEHYWKHLLETLIELTVEYECIYGIQGLSVNNSIKIKDDLELEITNDGYWTFVYTGHTGEFNIFNYKTKKEADDLMLDLKDNEFITSVFVVDIMCTV